MESNMKFDAVKFLKATLDDMRGDIKYAYPSPLDPYSKGTYDSSRGHAALQMVSSKIETLQNFLAALSQEEKD